MQQALVVEEEKRGLYKGEDGGGRIDKGETVLQHERTIRKPIKCFGCREENHVFRNCPERGKRHHEYRNKQGNSFKHKAARADADGTKNENCGSKVFGAGLITSEGGSCWVIDSFASQHIPLIVNYW